MKYFVLFFTLLCPRVGAEGIQPTREPKEDPNNLARPDWLFQGGGEKRVPGGSWDGSDAVRISGYPSRSWSLENENRKIYEKVRGQWVKIYVDTVGGDFNLAPRDQKTGVYLWISCSNSPDQKNWRRISHTFFYPKEEYERPFLMLYTTRRNKLFDNFRLYLLGTEPEELLQPLQKTWNPNLKNLIEDESFEVRGEAAVLPTGWHLEKGGARIVNTVVHAGKRSMKLMPDSVVKGPALAAEKGVQGVVHFWAKGRGELTVSSLDLDVVGVPLVQGSGGFGANLARQIPLRDQWLKIELTSNSYHPDCAGRQIIFSTSRDSEVFLDDVQFLRDTSVFPFPEKKRNTFEGEFKARGGTVVAIMNDKSLEGKKGAITGPTVLILKVTPEKPGKPVRISGGLAFASGGFVGPDPHWKMTTESPPPETDQLSHDDSAWKSVPLTKNGKHLEVTPFGPVWLRRVILWNTTPYLVPRVVQLPFDKGRADWLNIALSPPVPAKIKSYELLVDVPMGYAVVPYTAAYAAYLRAPEKVSEYPFKVRHTKRRYKRFVMTYDAGHVTGIAGSYRGGNSRISMVLIEHLGGREPIEGKLYLSRVTNGNVVDLPLEIDLVHVPLDGTRPEQVMVHDLWSNPYTIRNAPNAQLNIEAVDKIVETCIRSGMTHSGWPYKWVTRPYLFNPDYGPRWMSVLKKNRVQLMPVYHNFPYNTNPGTRTYEIAEKSPGAISKLRFNPPTFKDRPEYVELSFGWLLSDASSEYWEALRDEYKNRTELLEKGSGLKVAGYAWDYEFEVHNYSGASEKDRANDPLTLKLFADHAKLDKVPDWPTVRQKYSGEWYHYSRSACRQVIQRTYERVFRPLDLRFHVYYGEGRPFEKGNCDVISAYGIGQNISGQIRSVEEEYKLISRGKKIDPSIRFLGILQAEIQAVHRGRPFHWQEFRNNCVKRAIATHGGGPCIYTEVEPQCPGLPYGTASASRFIAKWERYFVNPDPVFAGNDLESIVKVVPMPSDIVLLKNAGKGLLVLFGDEPEKQDTRIQINISALKKTHRVTLDPMGLATLEIDLQ